MSKPYPGRHWRHPGSVTDSGGEADMRSANIRPIRAAWNQVKWLGTGADRGALCACGSRTCREESAMLCDHRRHLALPVTCRRDRCQIPGESLSLISVCHVVEVGTGCHDAR